MIVNRRLFLALVLSTVPRGALARFLRERGPGMSAAIQLAGRVVE
jgi:hypothetical protein